MYDIIYACHYQLKLLLMERSFNLLLENKGGGGGGGGGEGGGGYNLFIKQKIDLKKNATKRTFTPNVWEDNCFFITLLKKY